MQKRIMSLPCDYSSYLILNKFLHQLGFVPKLFHQNRENISLIESERKNLLYQKASSICILIFNFFMISLYISHLFMINILVFLCLLFCLHINFSFEDTFEYMKIYALILFWSFIITIFARINFLNILISTILCYFITEHCRLSTEEYNEKCKQIVK